MSKRVVDSYKIADVGLDLANPLQHGIVRYVPTESYISLKRNSVPSKTDRPYVYVPAGFVRREKEFMTKILDAMGLSLPDIIIVIPETIGSSIEQEDRYGVTNSSTHPVAKDWSDDEQKDVIKAKVMQLLSSILASSMEVGAWVIPDVPRRRNTPAAMICDLVATVASGHAEDSYSRVALGLIGLGEEEGDKDFRKAILSTMKPLETPITNAINLTYDHNIRDGAPLPQLTHMVVFESPEDRTYFRSQLLFIIPDFMVVYGNIASSGVNRIFENIKHGSPVIILEQTGQDIDKLVNMFQHVNNFLKTDPSNPSEIPPMDTPITSQLDEDLKLFLTTWPTNFSPSSIILCDPLIMTGQELQMQLLTAIADCFSLKQGGITSTAIRYRALSYAWAFQKLSLAHSLLKKTRNENIETAYVLFTILSISAAVFYNQVYGSTVSFHESFYQLAFYITTIILPLCITTLKHEVDSGKAMHSWAAFRVASVLMESQIFKFRTQSGKFRVETNTELALQRPVETFTKTITKIWDSLGPYLAVDGVQIPTDFWDDDKQMPVLFPSKPLTPFALLQEPVDQDADVTLVADPSSGKEEEESPLLEAEATSTVALIEPADQKISSVDKMKKEPTTKTTPLLADNDEEDPVTVETIDNEYASIRIDDYIRLRMQTMVDSKTKDVNKISFRYKTLDIMVKVFTILSGACAALNLQWFVPIVLGIVATLGSISGFQQYTSRIKEGNNLILELNKLKLWWMGLTFYEKQLPNNKDTLVLCSEKLIVAEMLGSFNGLLTSDDEDN